MTKKIALPKPSIITVGKLRQASLDELVQSLRANPLLKRDAVSRLKNDPLTFVEQVFDLTKAQQFILQSVAPKEMVEAFAHLFILALDNPDIRFVHTQIRGRPEFGMVVSLSATVPSLKNLVMTTRSSKKPTKKPTKGPKGDTVVVKGDVEFQSHC